MTRPDRPVSGYDLGSGYDFGAPAAAERYVVVASRGQGDEAAPAAAMSSAACSVGLVGSRRKAAALRSALAAKGLAQERLAAVVCPAGLDSGAVTPEEIALSILAESVECRRRGHRGTRMARAADACTMAAKESLHGYER